MWLQRATENNPIPWILFADDLQSWNVSVLSGNRRIIGYFVSQDEYHPCRWVRNFSREGQTPRHPRCLFQGLGFTTVWRCLTGKSAPHSFRFCGMTWESVGIFCCVRLGANIPSIHRLNDWAECVPAWADAAIEPIASYRFHCQRAWERQSVPSKTRVKLDDKAR